jgi:hypothetical protein
MKPFSTSVLFVICICLLAGCAEVTNYDLSSGFFIKLAIPSLTWESGGGTRELFYRGTNGKRRRVWEHVGAAYAGKGIAVFIGWREEENGPRGETYLAAKENGPVVAISKAVLTRKAKKDGIQPDEYLKRYGTYKLNVKDNVVQFEFSSEIGVNQPDFFVELTWDEISEIIDAVTKTGKPHKDKVSGLTYLE